MLATEFHKRLHEIGVDYSRKAILKWAHKGLVAPPHGRTKSALWTDEALGEAAAVYALRKRGVSFQIIDQIIRFVRLLPSDPSLLSSADLNSAEFSNNNNVPYSIFKHFLQAVTAYGKALKGVPLATPAIVRYTWNEKDGLPIEMGFSSPPDKHWIFQGIEVEHGADIHEDYVLPSCTHAAPSQK